MQSRSVAAGLLSVHLLCSAADAQSVLERPPTIGVYLDCQGLKCDQDFLRTEITFVTHLRDRHDADVHVLITSQPTVEGGTEMTLKFIGQKTFNGMDDSLVCVSRPGDTADQVRHELSDAIKRGLVRYANHTDAADQIKITYTPSADALPGLTADPWNRWTLGTSVNGFVAGEESTKSMSVGMSLSGNRTTDSWKISASIQSQFNSATFQLDADQKVKSIQRSFGFSSLIVGSVNDHVSLGGRVSALNSTFLNQSLSVRVAPAIEYNVFRYQESTNRMLTLEYSVGSTSVDYQEVTIYGKNKEQLLDERFLASLLLTQRWGSVQIAAEGLHYLHDMSKHRGTLFGSIDWNLARGLSLATTIDVKRIRDQLFLSARDVSDEEILLRQRQLSTSYTYAASLGIRYTFGSPLAQIVNRRFSGSLGLMNVVQ